MNNVTYKRQIQERGVRRQQCQNMIGGVGFVMDSQSQSQRAWAQSAQALVKKQAQKQSGRL